MAQAEIKAVITAEDRASRVVRGFGASVGDMAKGVAIGELAVKGITGALEKFKQAGQFAIQSAADFEQSRIAFETMLGSAAAAKKMLKDVSDFAAKTPFTLPEVVLGAKQLLAYNIEAKKILPTFKALGNIAAGVGKDKLPQLILAFGQVRAATKLTGMELRQFTEAGVPLLSTLATQLGKTEGQIQEMVSAGEIKFKDVEKAIFGMSQEGGKFFNLMDRQSKTFSGVMSNISDQFGRVARNIVGISETGEIREGSLFARLSKSGQGLLDFLNQNSAQITNFFQTLVDLLLQGGQLAGEFVNKVIEKFDALRAYLKENTIFHWFLQTAKDLLSDIKKAIDEEVRPAFKRLMDAFSDDGKEGMKIFGMAAGAAFLLMLTMIDRVLSKLAELMDYLASLKEAWNKVADAARNAIGNATSKIPGVGLIGNGKALLKDISGGIMGLFKAEGGPVASGHPYVVGERGPELFVPGQSGTIVPNGAVGGNTTVNFNVNVGTFVGTELEMRQLSERVMRAWQDLQSSRGMAV